MTKEKKGQSTQDQSINYFFQANAADHALTHYQLLFHTFLILAITLGNENSTLLLILSVLGFVSSIVSYLTLMRGDRFTNFWFYRMPEKLLKEYEQYMKKPFPIVKNSRYFTMIVLMAVYSIIFVSEVIKKCCCI